MRTRNILIGCGVLLILCIAASGIGFILIGPSIGKVVNTVTQGPYQIGARPLPADGNQDTLLPPSVGEFQRGDVQTANNTFTTTYTSGSTTINASAAAFESINAAHASVQAVKDKASTAQINVLGLDPSYVADDINSPTTLAYSRGRFFFSFTSSGKLDPFMSKFPY